MNEQEKRIVVLVLGDLGRSPRMLYHTQSLAIDHQVPVTLVGYRGMLQMKICLRYLLQHLS